MRILLLNSDNLQDPIGGLGIVIQKLIKFWGPEHELDVIGFGGHDVKPAPNIHYKVVRHFDVPNIQFTTYRSLFVQSSLIATALEFDGDPDLIVGCDWNTVCAARDIASFYEIPYIFWSHLSPSSYCVQDDFNNLIRIEEALELQGIDLADKILHVSESYSKRFPFNLYQDKVHIIRNGVELDEFSYKGKNPYPYKDKFNVLFLGRPTKQKGIYPLIELELPENVTLNFALANSKGLASVENLADIQKKCDDNPAQFSYLGDIRGKVKSNYLNHADALIIPSLSEPFGLVGLEGLASKTIVISSMVEGLGDFLKENVAIKCVPTKEGILEAIKQAQSLSVEERAIRIEKGYEIAKQHAWEKIVPQLKKFFVENAENAI